MHARTQSLPESNIIQGLVYLPAKLKNRQKRRRQVLQPVPADQDS